MSIIIINIGDRRRRKEIVMLLQCLGPVTLEMAGAAAARLLMSITVRSQAYLVTCLCLPPFVICVLFVCSTKAT